MDIEQALKMLEEQQGQKNDPPLSPVAPYGHGLGGLFNQRGIGPDIFNAMQLPLAGALSVIPVVNGGIDSENRFGGEDASFDTLLTGVTKGDADEFSNQPTADCATGPTGGLTKLCTIVNTYGRFRFATREVSMVRAGRRQDKCDPFTLRLLGQPQFQGAFISNGQVPSISNAIAIEFSRRLFESAASGTRMFAERIWTGSAANNSGERRDITGLSTFINSGNKADAYSGNICTAADSTILNFGLNFVGGAGNDIVRYIETLFLQLEWKASRQGLNPVEWVIFMRPELWDEVTKVWPVRQYESALNQIANFTNGRVMINANNALDDRNSYRSAMILPIRGRNIRVVVDDTMPEQDVTNNGNLLAGQYASDIYIVPMTVLGGIPVTFLEAWQYDNLQTMNVGGLFNLGYFVSTSDGGHFYWNWNFKNGCLQANWEFSPRLRVKTPQLGGRVTNVAYQPLLHLSSYDPDSVYYQDGGSTAYPGTSVYTSYSPTTPVVIS